MLSLLIMLEVWRGVKTLTKTTYQLNTLITFDIVVIDLKLNIHSL